MLTPRLSLAVLVSFAAALTVALSPPPPPPSASQSTAPRQVSNSTQSSSGRWPRDTPDLPPLDVRLWSLPVNSLAPLIMDATIFGTKWATVLNNVSTTVVTSAFIADMAATLGVSPSCMNATTVLALTNGSLQLCFVVSSTLPHTVNETLYLASQATLVNLSSVYFTHRNSSCGDCRAYSKSNIPLLYVSAFTVLDSSAGAGGMMLRVPPPADHTPLSPAPPVTPAAPVIVIVRSSSSDACDHDCLVIIVVACPVAVVLGCIGAFACWIVKSKNPPPAQDASMPTQAQIATMPHTWDAETLHAIANHPLARGRRQVPINSGDTVFIDLSTAPNPLEAEPVVERNSSRKPKRGRRVVFVMEVPTEEETSHPQEDSAFDDPKVKLEEGGDEGTT